MKLNNSQLKELNCFISEHSNKVGYKVKSNTIFAIKDSAFVFCNYLIVNSEKIVYRIYIKDYDYDNIFWEILQMQENIKKNASLRACGAFKAPGILLKKGELKFTERYYDQAEDLVNLIENCSCDFVKNNNIDEYIINNTIGMDESVLKCLAFLHTGKKEDALKLVNDAVNNNISSGYKNEEKDFWEWALLIK